MVLLTGFPTAEHFRAQLSLLAASELSSLPCTPEQAAAIASLYAARSQHFLGIGAPEDQRTLPLLPLEVFGTQRFGLRFYRLLLGRLGPANAALDVLLAAPLATFLGHHTALLAQVPVLRRFTLSAQMPAFLRDVVAQIASRFPFLEVELGAEDPFSPVLQQLGSAPDRLLVTAPFADAGVNAVQRNRLRNRAQPDALDANKARTVVREVTGASMLLHVMRSPASFDQWVPRTVLARKPRGPETHRMLTMDGVGVVSFLYFLDAAFFNDLPDVMDYSATDLVADALPPQTVPLRQRFVFRNVKFASLPTRQVLQAQRAGRVLAPKALAPVASFALRLGRQALVCSKAAVNVANYEVGRLNAQNTRLHSARRFSRAEAELVAATLPDLFPVRQYVAHCGLYVYNPFIDEAADTFIKAEIMRLGLQSHYAKKITDRAGRSHELADLVRGIGERTYGAIDAPHAIPGAVLSPEEEALAAELGVPSRLFVVYRAVAMQLAANGVCARLAALEAQHHLPFTLLQCERVVGFYARDEVQRLFSAGPFALNRAVQPNTGVPVRTADPELQAAANLGVFGQMLGVFDRPVDGAAADAISRTGSLGVVRELSDRVVGHYAARFQ
ncbi:hypothetical protein SS50377_27961 [Spironucleus salmonicida]|uniref:Uncharacterized protein n=1 Tax=Spironucleus salmonicida TaxID=348837 RepID=A0A9P8LKU3_9EUKA|nr:hypothetical protein SS50377_27961 [Spironucleus salmonicida]